MLKHTNLLLTENWEAKLKDVLDIDISGREYIYLHANLGEITKVELNLVELNKKLESG